MGLVIRRVPSLRFKLVATLIAVFALVAQPLYGLASYQIAHAMISNPEGLSATTLASATTCDGWSNPLVVTATAGVAVSALDQMRSRQSLTSRDT